MAIQPAASFTDILYAPAANPVNTPVPAVGPAICVGVVNVYVNGAPAPPVGIATVHEPLDNPKQVTFIMLLTDVVGLPKLITVYGTDRVQVLTSLIITVWGPAANPVVVADVTNPPPSYE